MMLVKANPQHLLGEKIDAWKYDYNFENIALSAVSLTGTYPKTKTEVNHIADIIYLIFDGSAEFTVNDEKSIVVKGDIFIISKGSQFTVCPHLCELVKMWMLDHKKEDLNVDCQVTTSEISKFFRV